MRKEVKQIIAKEEAAPVRAVVRPGQVHTVENFLSRHERRALREMALRHQAGALGPTPRLYLLARSFTRPPVRLLAPFTFYLVNVPQGPPFSP